MSTEIILHELSRRGILKLWEPSTEDMDGDDKICRRIYMRPDVYKWVMTKARTLEEIKYFENLREFLKRYVVGDYFDNSNKLKNLDVDELRQEDRGYYAFRLQRIDPSERIFGSFAAPNIFIATHKMPRENFAKGKAIWAREKLRVLEIWRQFNIRIRLPNGNFANEALERVSELNRAQLTCNNRSMNDV